MGSLIYEALASLGYHHPLHPAVTHLPVGLVFGGFLFGLGALYLRQDAMAKTAHHCMTLALIGLIPTIILGFIDWQQFYGSAYITPIKMKIILGFVLLILLAAAVYVGIKAPKDIKTTVLYGLSVIAVAGLGYFGGELVFGSKPPKGETVTKEAIIPPAVTAGSVTFKRMCAGCHFVDRADFKAGPGLKGLFKKDTLYGSDWPATAENIRKQITHPYGTMPAYQDMPEEKLDELMAYLKTL